MVTLHAYKVCIDSIGSRYIDMEDMQGFCLPQFATLLGEQNGLAELESDDHT